MRRVRGIVLFAACASAGLGGCNWNDFDEVLAKAPVLSLGAPEGYASRDVGKVVLPLSVPAARSEAVSGRYLIAGTETPSLAVIELDKAGRAQSRVASKVEIMDMAGEAKATVKSAVQLGDGRIVLGTPSYSLNTQQAIRGRIYFLTLVDGAGGLEFKLVRGGETGERISFGNGVAAGKVMGAAEDVIVSSQNDVVVIEGGNELAPFVANRPECLLEMDPVALEKYRFRALVTGAFIEGGGDEVAVGVPREGAPGRVVILTKGAGALDCPVVIEAPAALPRFGTAIVGGDFTGDGKPDLLVGAPPLRAYLFAGPFAAGKTVTPMLELKNPNVADSGVTGDFGYRVLGVDIDGAAGPEIVVSAPELPVGADTGVGRVFVFRPGGTMALTEIGDNSPESEASFGSSLAAVPFAPKGCGTTRSVLVVGASKEVFTFFRVPGGAPDPRCL